MTPDDLLAGPRGRRLLMEYVRLSEEVPLPAGAPLPFHSAVFQASHHLGPQTGRTYGRFTAPSDQPGEFPELATTAYGNEYPEVMPPDAVARRIRETPLADPTPDLLFRALGMSVDSAMHWQPPDGEDVLASCTPVTDALQDAATLIAASSLTGWWSSPVDMADQWTVRWGDDPGEPVTGESTCPAEGRRGGEWWSFPPHPVPSSARRVFDGERQVPASLAFLEDALRDDGWVRGLHVPDSARAAAAYEITGADDWAELCRRFPLDVTGSVEREWGQVTGGTVASGSGQRWVVPDWAAVSRHYDGVHLTAAAYLSSATRAIPVGDRASGGTASMIAGWAPDETDWFTQVKASAETQRWEISGERWIPFL